LFNRIWKDPVWSKVIATGIIGMLVFIADHYLNILSKLQNFANITFAYINSSTEIKNWLLLIMSLCSLLVGIFLIALIWNLFFSKKEQIGWKSYQSDNFYGLEWHWEYNMFTEEPEELYTLCPNCKYQLFPDEHQYPTPILKYHCENCHTQFPTINLLYSNLKHKIILNIQQKLRTGAYRQSTVPNKSLERNI
jgi:hypothetical protein